MNTQKFSTQKLIFAAILLTSFSNALVATTQEMQQPDSSRLSEFLGYLSEEEEGVAVTTGVSRPLKKEQVPASITVVTADEIKLLGLKNLTEVIDFIVPGGVGGIHRSTRTGLYAFRGITVDNNGKYVFMVDGINVGNLSVWGAFNERFLGLMDDLDRIEIIQGTGSILYGSGAISGIINFITKTGNTFQGREYTAGYGSWDRIETTLKTGNKAADANQWTYFLYGGYKNSHGVVPDGGEGPRNAAATKYEHAGDGRYWDHFNHSGKFQANLTKGDFTLRARFVQDRFEEPFRNDVSPVVVNTSDVYWLENYWFIQPEITKRLSDTSSIRANISFVMNESGMEKIHDWYKNNNLVLETGDRQNTSGERKIRGQLFHYYDGWANHKLTTGLELFWMYSGPDFHNEDFVISANGAGQKVESEYMEREKLYFGALFFEDMWKWNDRTTFFIGARAEDHNKTPANISPRVAVSYDCTPKTNIKLLYNRGFRTPDWQYYSVNDKNGVEEPKPEKVDSFEAHVTHRVNQKLSFTTIGYYTIYKDLINYWNGAYRNFPTVRAIGVEFSGDYRSENLKLGLSHSFSKPYHISDENFDQVALSYDDSNWAQFPTNMTKAHAIISLVKDKCLLGLLYWRNWGIKGHKGAFKLRDSADYLNATLTFKLNRNAELQLSGYNLLGENHPWWGANTTDGVSRDVDTNTEYFVRLIWKF
jgi:outer membrane receptor protein involved in Fe transport